MKQRRKHGGQVLILLGLSALGACLVQARAETAEPDPLELLKTARMASASQEAVVRGQLRSGDETAPFTLSVNFGKLRFSFDRAGKVLEVRLGQDSSDVRDGAGNTVERGMREPVAANTDVTVEDLSLGFLYWPDAKLMGDEIVRTRSAWKIELRPGKRGSEFAVVRVWLDKSSGALLRVDGFDWEGHLLRRFEVVSGQRIDGQWMLKQMRIERYAAESSSRPVARTYLEILGKGGG